MNVAHYTDKYFTRAKDILSKDGVNPWVVMQVFVRKGPGVVGGIGEAIDILHQTPLKEHGGIVRALHDGSPYESCETVMTIEGPLQDIVEYETLYLGVISAGTTRASGDPEPNLRAIESRMRNIVELAQRPVLYFGARHWHYKEDAAISAAAFRGGASACSTDSGAQAAGQKGVGTIPHALVLAYGDTVTAAQAFDKYIDTTVPRVVLVDTFNKEITDSLRTAAALPNLSAVRLDTCGENVHEGGTDRDTVKYLWGKGVTIEAATRLRNALREHGHDAVQIVLTSGFGNPVKVEAFVNYEKKTGERLFDSLGVGAIYDSRAATADIVMKDGKPFSKVGRGYHANPRLEVVL